MTWKLEIDLTMEPRKQHRAAAKMISRFCPIALI
jgi:hypothetical protein